MIYVLLAETKGLHLVLSKTALPRAADELFRRLEGAPLGFSEAAAKALSGDALDLADFFLTRPGDFVWFELPGDPPVRSMYTMESPNFSIQTQKDRH